MRAGGVLDVADLGKDGVELDSHAPVHGHGALAVESALDQHRAVSVAGEERQQLGGGNSGQDGGSGNLVPVQMQDGQHGAVASGIEELVRVPSGGRRPGLCLTVAHHTGDHQVGIVECGPEGMAQRVAELTALVDGPRGLRAAVTGDAAGEGELAKQPSHALTVARDVGIALAVGAFEPGVGHDGRPPVTWTADEDGAEIQRLDAPAQVGVDEVEPGAGPPVTQQPWLDVLGDEGPPQQRVVHEVDLAGGEVVGSPEVGVEWKQLIGFRPSEGWRFVDGIHRVLLQCITGLVLVMLTFGRFHLAR